MNIFWFRRDLRLDDNAALYTALRAGNVLPVFIFDTNILNDLKNKNDRRVSFIYERVCFLKSELEKKGSTLLVLHGSPVEVFGQLLKRYPAKNVFAGRDYEPYAVNRDKKIAKLLKRHDTGLKLIKDHVIFENDEVKKSDQTPYIVYTPYMKSWRKQFFSLGSASYPSEDLLKNLYMHKPACLPALEKIGFNVVEHGIQDPCLDLDVLKNYHKHRDFPCAEATSRLGPHLRFGTVSVRKVAAMALDINQVWLNQLIWRDFFIQILARFPYTANRPFRKKYEAIAWRNNRREFNKWCEGMTGYPIVDAGMRQLNETGYMHNRVRMVTANFLTKLLLVDWRWGEAWFAGKLLDYEMANNVGGWQWACGCGVDAAPYFRIFNPATQIKKFDPELKYINQWVPEFDTPRYPQPMLDYRAARERALSVYKTALSN
jgi:deoxyribodipyrimidine photo-lyase